MGMIEWLPDDLKDAVALERRRWLVTGAAGFIARTWSKRCLGSGRR